MTAEYSYQGKAGTAEIKRYAWIAVAVTVLAGLVAPINQFKVPPVMPVLMEKYALDLTSAGLLMSIFAITGLALALPAGLLMHRWGTRATGLLAVGAMSAGAILGSLSDGIPLLLLSRLVEGVGMGLIAVVGPAVVAMWFPPKKRGLPMGIWTTWVPLGSLIIYNLAPWINDNFGWKTVWWSIAAFSVAVFLVFWMFFREPPDGDDDNGQGKVEESSLASFKNALRSRDIWLLAGVFACYNFVVIGVIATFYPTFLKTVQHTSLAEASFVTSIKMAVTILLAPFVGWLTDRLASPGKIIMGSMFFLMIWMLFPFNLSGWQVSVLMIFLGIFAAGLASSTFSSVPEVTRAGNPIGVTIAVLMIGQNLGQLLGPVVFGDLVEQIGWTAAGYWMIIVLAIGLACAWLISRKKGVQFSNEQV